MPEYSGDSTCWSLIQDAATGSGSARSVFARTYLPLVRSFFAARWAGPQHASEVEDAVQETFVVCFGEHGPLSQAEERVRDFRAYLFGIVRNVAKQFEKRRGRQRVADPVEVAQVTAREQAQSRAFDKAWALTMMRKAGELMEARAEADTGAARLRIELLRLRFQKGLPIREIAIRWEMDPDSVHRAYALARDEFHSCLRATVRDHAVRTDADLDVECRRILAQMG